MDLETFLNLSTDEVARIVRAEGPKVCVFPINGTRRWFMLEYPELARESFMKDYLRISGQRHIELYELFFDHGVETLVTPIFGPDLLERGDQYRTLLQRGLLWFAQNEDFLDFYASYDVRVHIYGDAERHLQDTSYADALDAYETVARSTADHQSHRLFFGVCAHDATEAVAAFSADFYQENGNLPKKREIVAAYYGEYVPPVDLFIGFADRPAVFDMPLIATGSEDLYFTVAPSPYLNACTLRAILYDHIYARQVDDADYEALSPRGWQALGEFYNQNRHHALGLGRRHESKSFWYPLPQVELSPAMRTAQTKYAEDRSQS
jgi:tuberculosinol/isotuberculosinol synthase